MTSNALPPHGDSHDEEILRMMDVGEFAELNDFLGEILHPEISPDLNSSMVAMRTTAQDSSHHHYHHQQGCAPVSPLPTSTITSASGLPLAPAMYISDASMRVSPAHSVSGGDSSSGDDSSTGPGEDGIPHTVTTGMLGYCGSVQDAHEQHQQAASKDDVVAKKKIRRRERNREHAKKCRFRKKNYLKSLEESVLELKQENDKLRRMVMTRYTKDEITSMGREPSEQLATGLKKSNCKATTKSAESYLQSLRDECKMDNET